MGPHPFERLFAPRGVVVFGAERADSIGGRILRKIAAGGYAGALHAVGARDVVPGARASPSLGEIEGPLDLAVIASPAAQMREIVRACGERGLAGAVIPVLTSPEARRDAADSPLARGLREEAARHHLRLLGPHSVGLVRPAARLEALLGSYRALPGSLALVSQSGAICSMVLDWAAAHHIGLSAVASLGDAVDVDFGDVLEYLAFDDLTRSILLHVERIRSARSFLSGLRLAAHHKPVVVVKAGRYAAPALDAAGSAPSADDAFDAALARAGAVRVASIEQLFAAAQLLAAGRRVAGHGLAILTNAHGPGLLAADRAADLGVSLAPLGDETAARLDAVAPTRSGENPVDLRGDAPPSRYAAAVEICQADPEVNAVLAMLAPQALAQPLETAEAVIAASRGAPTPLLACWLGEDAVREARARFVAAGIPQFATPESAVEAFGHLASYARSQQLLRQAAGPVAPDASPLLTPARDAVLSALSRGRDRLTTVETRKLLAAIGVRLDAAAGHLLHGPGLWVGVSRDGTFGPVIRFGPGAAVPGIAPRRIVALPPLSTGVIRTLIESSPFAGTLSAGEALSAGEVLALERMLWALSELVCELPELREVEIHPLAPNRTELVAVAASASVAPAEPGARPYAHMAIHPYPSHIRARWELADGTRVTVRPIRPEDARMEAQFVRDLSPHTRYFRFMVPIRELTDDVLFRFTQIDYDRELALLALVEREAEELEIAVARYVMLPDGRSAEVAIVVADAWQGKGLGVRLLGMLVEEARARGIPRLEGEALAENAGSRKMLTRLGFKVRANPKGAETFLFEKELGSRRD